MTTPAGVQAGAKRPVQAGERVQSLDVLRGFALLGILVPNIVAFSWPSAAMADPGILGGGFWNNLGHDLTATLFLGKFMFLFSMLFGAGVVFFDRKARKRAIRAARCMGCGYDLTGLLRGTKAEAVCPECGIENSVETARLDLVKTKLSDGAGLWYRRTAWLLAIGLVHATCFWFGDILVWYAINGMLAIWWMRRLNPKLQVGLGIGLHALGTLLMFGLMAAGVWAVSAGKLPPDEMMGDVKGEFAAYAGTYFDAFKSRLMMLVFMWLLYGPLFVPAVTGMMLMGIGLTRLGVLTGERSRGFYGWLALLGVVGGLALTACVFLLTKRFAPMDMGNFVWQSYAQFVGIPLGLGYAGLLIFLLKSGWLTPLLRGFQAVGRMALSNYLSHTLICTTFFYGYGFGYFGKIEYPWLWVVVGSVWCFNFVFSTLWLRSFRFGPAEWAWRSLTYWKLQPLRKAVTGPAGAEPGS